MEKCYQYNVYIALSFISFWVLLNIIILKAHDRFSSIIWIVLDALLIIVIPLFAIVPYRKV